MFKKLYTAGQNAAQNSLQKFIWSKNSMTPEEKTEATGILGIALGNILENVAIGGMVIGLIAAVALGAAPGGLTLGAFLGLGALGTALAGVGVFGKGMMDKGDEMAGNVIAVSKEFRKGLMKAVWNDLRGKKQPDIFGPGAEPASSDFNAAVAGETAKPAVVATPVAKPSSPEMR